MTRLLEPTYHALYRKLRAGPIMGLDQTSWPDLEDSTVPPWQMWCLMRGRAQLAAEDVYFEVAIIEGS